jgi:hypothetical protein
MQKSNLGREASEKYFELEQQFTELFMNKCKVVFATCNMTAHPLLQENFWPSITFIDHSEAATIPDLAVALVAFQHCNETVVLCGDGNGKNPVVTSRDANEMHAILSQSLFKRLPTRTRPQSAMMIGTACTH